MRHAVALLGLDRLRLRGELDGDFTARRLHTCWFGLIRAHVGGNALMVGGRFGDPDAMEIVTNVIGGHQRGECAAL
jgi:hypothetical protein